ncbi:hypothetical protein B484DRAFT_408329 [Ochromonadaceae sp. CCMP2298]|nr:hypothetical protein B484DRAFT_408329 [Ochromonadaceae sp. CCMP2298]
MSKTWNVWASATPSRVVLLLILLVVFLNVKLPHHSSSFANLFPKTPLRKEERGETERETERVAPSHLDLWTLHKTQKGLNKRRAMDYREEYLTNQPFPHVAT